MELTAESESLDRSQLEQLWAFLGRIQQEPPLRDQLNLVQTAVEVSEIARVAGHIFQAETLIQIFQLCNEQPYARAGLMDEKLIRVFLRRDSLL